MNFAWSRQQEELYARVAGFASALGKPACDGNGWFTREVWRQCGAAGLLGLQVAPAYGGGGHDALSTAYAMEALGYAGGDLGLGFSIGAHLFACVEAVAAFGCDALKERWLRRMCSGKLIAANATTEPNAGSDVHALETRAVRDGDSYLLTGEKVYVTNGPVADVMVVYATTNPRHGYLGICAFLVERETPGLMFGAAAEKMGLRSSPSCSIRLQDCRVPACNLIGTEGQGASIFQTAMAWERTCLTALYVGVMERQLECCVARAKTRRQFGAPIGRNQAISHRIANMKERLDAARLLLYRACWLMDTGADATLAISVAKLAVSEAAIQSSLDAIQIHGAEGYSVGSGIERTLRDSIPSTIFSGTSEMHRNLIATVLGL